MGFRIIVKKLLSRSDVELNCLNYGWTPISRYSTYISGPKVNARLSRRDGLHGVQVHDGRSPLHLACETGQVIVVRMLIQHPAVDVNVRSRSGFTPLHIACEHDNEDVVDALLGIPKVEVNAIDDVGATPLHSAAKVGATRALSRMLSDPRVDVNVMTYRYHDGGQGTPLHVACQNGHQGTARILLRHARIDPYLSTHWGGKTVLHVAAELGLTSVVGRLLTFPKIAVHALQDDGLTALELAIREGRTEVVELLRPVNLDPKFYRCGTGFTDGISVVYPTAIRWKCMNKVTPKVVALLGDFNDWDSGSAIPMQQVKDRVLGTYYVCVMNLPAGMHFIQFVVDGVREIDSQSTVLTKHGHTYNVVRSGPWTRPDVIEGPGLPLMLTSRIDPNIPPEPLPPYHQYSQIGENLITRPPINQEQQQQQQPPRPSDTPSGTPQPVPSSAVSLSENGENLSELYEFRQCLGMEIKFLNDFHGNIHNVAVVHSVKPGGPADWCGVKINDILHKVDGYEISNRSGLMDIVLKHQHGDVLSLYLIRDGAELRKLITLEGARVRAAPRSVRTPTTADFDGLYSRFPATEYPAVPKDSLGYSRYYSPPKCPPTIRPYSPPSDPLDNVLGGGRLLLRQQ